MHFFLSNGYAFGQNCEGIENMPDTGSIVQPNLFTL